MDVTHSCIRSIISFTFIGHGPLYSVEWSVRRHRHKLRSHSSSKLQSFARMPSHEMIAFPTISFLPASQIAQTRSATQLLTGFSHAMANRELARQALQFYLMTAQKESNSSLTPALGCTYNSSARVLSIPHKTDLNSLDHSETISCKSSPIESLSAK